MRRVIYGRRVTSRFAARRWHVDAMECGARVTVRTPRLAARAAALTCPHSQARARHSALARRVGRRSPLADKPGSYTKPNKQFPWSSHKSTAPVKKMTKAEQKGPWIRREREIRMAPVLGRLGAAARCSLYNLYMIAFCDATLIGLSWGWELVRLRARSAGCRRIVRIMRMHWMRSCDEPREKMSPV